jgi:hypothetical protein
MNKPDYKNSLTNLSNSILKHFGVAPFHSTIKSIDDRLLNSKKIVMFLFDGLGEAIIKKHLKEDDYLRKNIFTNITSTFSPTTVAATNSILSARFPIETGWLGWSQYFKDLDKNIFVFPNIDEATGKYVGQENQMLKIASYKSIVDLINENNKQTIAYDMKGFPVDKNRLYAKFLSTFMKKAYKNADKTDKSFVYAYWTRPDSIMHRRGTIDKKVHRYIKKINRLVKRYAEKNKDVTTIVIADHGFVDVSYFDMRDHSDLMTLLKRPFSLEGRCSNFFIKNGKQNEFKTLFNKYYPSGFELYTKEEILNMKIYGDAEPNPISLDFIGDFIAIAVGNYALRDNDHPEFKAHHGGATLDELMISVNIIH